MIKLKKWKIKLPLVPPGVVIDNSELAEYQRCPRRGLYKYGLSRSLYSPTSINFPIQFGLAYHKFREELELRSTEGAPIEKDDWTKIIHEILQDWEQPDPEHKHGHLDAARLILSCKQAVTKVNRERKTGEVVVTQTESPFDLELPVFMCSDCHYTTLDADVYCPQCEGGQEREWIPLRHGGRVDQFIRLVKLAKGNIVRDFKSTGRMGKTYPLKFEPNGQLQGYVWAFGELSGKQADGALVETVYTAKGADKKEDLISQTFVTFSPGQQEQWIASVMMERQIIQTMFDRANAFGYLAFPQRTNACGDFGGCGYRDACLSGSGFEIEEFLKAETVEHKWDFMNPDGEDE